MKTTSYQLCYASFFIIAVVPAISAFVNLRPVGRRTSSLLHQTANDKNNDKEAPTHQCSFMTTIGTWFIVGSLTTTPVIANAVTEAECTNTLLDVCPGTPSSSLLVTTDHADDGMSVSNYIRQVFGSPLVGNTPDTPAKPAPTDEKYDTREARNRAYDEAFQQDARDRDAYYGQMAMRKRQEANQNVQQYRESLGLDGTGDVRMRVGEERVQGLSSLRELKDDYLSSSPSQQQDDSSQATDEMPAK